VVQKLFRGRTAGIPELGSSRHVHGYKQIYVDGYHHLLCSLFILQLKRVLEV
jgi:hypothetical protein